MTLYANPLALLSFNDWYAAALTGRLAIFEPCSWLLCDRYLSEGPPPFYIPRFL